MCRAGGRRCPTHVKARLARAQRKYARAQKALAAGKGSQEQVERLRKQVASAKVAFSKTTAYEDSLLQKANELRDKAAQAKAAGKEASAKRYSNLAAQKIREAEYARRNRQAHNIAGERDVIMVKDPITGKEHPCSRFLIHNAVNAQNAAQDENFSGRTPGVNGNLENPENTWAVKYGGYEETLAEATRQRELGERCALEREAIKRELKEYPKAAAKTGMPPEGIEARMRALRSKERKLMTEQANANRAYTQLLAASQGAKDYREGKIGRVNAGAVARACIYDTKDEKGQVGRGLNINARNDAMHDRYGRVPKELKGSKLVEGSVVGTRFTTHNNGQVIDAQVKVNEVYNPKTKQYHLVTSTDGKCALFTSNNSLEGYRPGKLATNQKTSKGRFENYEISGPFSSKRAVRRARTKMLGTLSCAPGDSSSKLSGSAVGRAVKAADASLDRRLRRGSVAHPYTGASRLDQINEVY